MRFRYTVLLSSTWPGLPYTLSTPDGSWLTLEQTVGATPERDSALTGDRAIVTAIPVKLAPGNHYGTVIVSAWQADPITIEVAVTVTMPKQGLSLPLITSSTLPAQPPQ